MIKATADATGAMKRLDSYGKQAVFAARLAVNETVKIVHPAMQRLMVEKLDQPTRFTLKSTFIRYAKRGETAASIVFREEAGKGTPANKYLKPVVDGEMRRLKRYERALQAKGLMPRGMMAVGGKYAVDAAGNLRPRTQIIPMLSVLQAFGEQGYMANRTQSSIARQKKRTGEYYRKTKSRSPGGHYREFFVLTERKHGKLPGVYERWGKGTRRRVKPIVIFTRQQHYAKILPWYETAQALIEQELPRQFKLALAKALATMRP